MPRVRISRTAVGCGTTCSMVMTVIYATGWLPAEFREPEVVAALTGLLTTIASAFRVCDFFSRSSVDSGE